MKLKNLLCCVVGAFLLSGCQSSKEVKEEWQLIPFVKNAEGNICLTSLNDTKFRCPILRSDVFWEAKDVFNPATVVRNDTLFMLYRAEDEIGKYAGTSRVGLAFTTDGMHFQRLPYPVLFPDNDAFKIYEWEGGIEDPRIVEGEDGTYYLTYTAYDGKIARLFIATSTDLRTWKKYGSVFRDYNGGELVDIWSKSGAIVCRREGSRLIATKIDGKYWMYWGESNIYMATSDDLLSWSPVEASDTTAVYDEIHHHRGFQSLMLPRDRMFDSGLVEPGPPAILTDKGIIFIYNARNSDNGITNPDPDYEVGSYSPAQVLIDKNDPMRVIERADTPFLTPDTDAERTGQVNNVCFAEGLSYYKGKWWLYYGTADSKIAVAECDKQ